MSAAADNAGSAGVRGGPRGDLIRIDAAPSHAPRAPASPRVPRVGPAVVPGGIP